MDIRSYFSSSSSSACGSSDSQSIALSTEEEIHAVWIWWIQCVKKVCRGYISKWEQDFPWLEFNEDVQGAFCKECKKLVWPAGPIPPLLLTTLRFIVEGEFKGSSSILVQLRTTHIQVCGNSGWVVDVLGKHYKIRCITWSMPATVTAELSKPATVYCVTN